MKNYRISFSLGRTLNMGSYESVRIDVGLSADVEDGEDRDEKWDELKREALAMMTEEVNTWKT